MINPMPSQHHKAPKTTTITTSTISQRRVQVLFYSKHQNLTKVDSSVQLLKPNNGGGALAPAVDFLPPPQRIVAAKPAYSSTTNINTSHHRRRPQVFHSTQQSISPLTHLFMQQLQLQPNIFRDNAAGGLALNMDAAKPQPHNNDNFAKVAADHHHHQHHLATSCTGFLLFKTSEFN